MATEKVHASAPDAALEEGARQRIAAEVLSEQLAGVAGRLTVALLAVVGNSVVVALVLRRSLGNAVWAWVAAVWAVSAVRYGSARRWRGGDDHSSMSRLRRTLVGGSFVNGILWGSLVLGMGRLTSPEQSFVAVVMMGMSVGATASNFTYLPSFLAFQIPAFLPLEIWLARSQDHARMALGLMGLVFFGSMVTLARKGSEALVEALESRARNRALAQALGTAREQLAAVNAGLEERVREQTRRLIEVERELGQAALLAGIGSLSASVAHGINSPLAGVMANLAWLERELAHAPGEEGAALREAVAEAREGAARVRDIVRNLGALAAPDTAGPPAADVRETLEACAVVIGSELRHRARLVREYGDVPRVGTDRARLAQVLLGLVLHAVRSVPPGAPDRHEIRLRTGWNPVLRQVQVEVSDTGPALAASARARLFDLEARHPDAGPPLGLSLCQHLVTAVGGSIRARGAEGQPNVIEVLLPVAVDGEA